MLCLSYTCMNISPLFQEYNLSRVLLEIHVRPPLQTGFHLGILHRIGKTAHLSEYQALLSAIMFSIHYLRYLLCLE